MNETWRKHPQYAIEVSNLGRVRGLSGRLHPGTRGKGGHTLTRVPGHSSKKFVHRLILETFVGPCPSGKECRHLDGRPSNNRVRNLKWGTRREQKEDMRRHGTILSGAAHPTYGRQPYNYKGKKVWNTAFRLIRSGRTYREVGKMLGICHHHVGVRWRKTHG